MLFRLGAKAQSVNQFQRIAQGIAAAELVFYLAEDFTDFILDGIGSFCSLLEALQIGEQFLIHEFDQVFSSQRLIVVEATVLLLWRGPSGPAVLALYDVGIFLVLK